MSTPLYRGRNFGRLGRNFGPEFYSQPKNFQGGPEFPPHEIPNGHIWDPLYKAFFLTWKGCFDQFSLSTIVAKLQSPSSPSTANQTSCPLRNRRRRPRSTLPPKEFEFPQYSTEFLLLLGFFETLAGLGDHRARACL